MEQNEGKRQECAEATEAYRTVDEFFHRYLVERSAQRAGELLTEDLYSVGTGDGEVAIGRDAFIRLMEEEIALFSTPLYYTISDYVQKERGPGSWDCLCNIQPRITSGDSARTLYFMRLTAGIVRVGEAYRINMLHASVASSVQEEGELLHLKFIAASEKRVSRETRQELFKIMSEIMPGGIVGFYLEEGFPLYVINQRLLRMLKYEDSQDYNRDIHGMVINSIHPDDREEVKAQLGRLTDNVGQYEIEYRVRQKDGRYIWVHEIGRRTVADDGRGAVISVLVDISQQVCSKNRLMHQVTSDPLTDVYNRKGMQEQVARLMPTLSSYLFLMMDLDCFKQVNDIYGHQEGDRALCEMGRLLKDAFRKSDVVGRMGGDEFAVLVVNCADQEVADRKIRWLIDSYAVRVQKNWPLSHSTLSVGGVLGRRSRSFAELYQLADQELYKVKNTCKGRYKIEVLD